MATYCLFAEKDDYFSRNFEGPHRLTFVKKGAPLTITLAVSIGLKLISVMRHT